MRLTTLEFLQQLLKGQTVPVGVPDFASTATTISEALEDLDAAIAEAQTSDAKPVG